jgi:hypothetical protein
MRSTLASLIPGSQNFQMLKSAPFSEGAMGTDIHPYPEDSADSLMDVSQSNINYMSARKCFQNL